MDDVGAAWSIDALNIRGRISQTAKVGSYATLSEYVIVGEVRLPLLLHWFSVVWLLHDRDARSYRGSGGWALHIQVLFLYWAALWSRLPGHSVCLVAMPLIPCHWLLGMMITPDVLQWYGDASAVWYSMHNNPFGTELAKLVGMFPRLCFALNQVVVYYELLGPLLLLIPAPRWSPALQVCWHRCV